MAIQRLGAEQLDQWDSECAIASGNRRSNRASSSQLIQRRFAAAQKLVRNVANGWGGTGSIRAAEPCGSTNV